MISPVTNSLESFSTPAKVGKGQRRRAAGRGSSSHAPLISTFTGQVNRDISLMRAIVYEGKAQFGHAPRRVEDSTFLVSIKVVTMLTTEIKAMQNA